MNTLLKIVVFSAPLFALTLFVFLQVHKKFEADYAVESVRFEREWRNWERDFGMNATEDEFLKLQEEEARRLWRAGKEGEKNLGELEKNFQEVLREMDENATGNGTSAGGPEEEAARTERNK